MSAIDQQFAASQLLAEQTEGLKAGGFLGASELTMATEILPGLWVGGCKDGVPLPHDFGFVLSLYPWERYQLGPATDRLQVRLFDGAEIPDRELLFGLAHVVINQCEERKVLVHCQAGLNRSNLVTALALILGPHGMKPDEAISLLRQKRSPYVLCNPVFEAWLRALDGHPT